jgi:hypothetical protein
LGGIGENPSRPFFAVISSLFNSVIFVCVFLILATSSGNAEPVGFLEGNFKIISLKEVELAEEPSSKSTAGNYADYPLIVLSLDGKKEIARVTADGNGNYRVALPPGDYVLDVQDRRRRHIRATPQPFTIVANRTVRVDMAIDTGVR